MNTTALRRTLSTGLVGIGVAVALASAAPDVLAEQQVQAQGASSVEVKDWDVYVDLPTRFAFVKTPNRWVFVRQLDEEQTSRLPASTLTALLPVDDSEIRYAHPALEPSPRVQAMRNGETRQAGVDPAGMSARR